MDAMDRRRFIKIAGRTVPVVIGVPYVVACANSTEPVDDTDNTDNAIVSISSVNAGHSHRAEIPNSDVASTGNKNYDSSNSGGHIHTVTFTAADFETLRTDGEVTISSSTNSGHAHSFTFRT
jgi:hypothetical protein